MLTAQAAFTGFSVDHPTKVKEFYTQVLGLTLDNDTSGLRLKLPNGGSLFIYSKPDHQPATYTVLNFVVADIDAAVDELRMNGVEMERYSSIPNHQDENGVLRGRASGYGPDIAWFKDPAGNILFVLQNT